MLVNRQLRHVCIAWRGTEQTKIKDLLTDISFAPSALGPERVAGSSDTLPGDGLGGTLVRCPVVLACAVSCALFLVLRCATLGWCAQRLAYFSFASTNLRRA